MTVKRKNRKPDFLDTGRLDPVSVATGPARAGQNNSSKEEQKNSSKDEKKKAGFYLSADLLDRFNRAFYELKLAGPAVGNKSTLVEAALELALEDLGRGRQSRIRKMLAEARSSA
ncbi:MAG: hypothetical protein ACLFS7_05855 [Desulfosudaceae bacterium]